MGWSRCVLTVLAACGSTRTEPVRPVTASASASESAVAVEDGLLFARLHATTQYFAFACRAADGLSGRCIVPPQDIDAVCVHDRKRTTLRYADTVKMPSPRGRFETDTKNVYASDCAGVLAVRGDTAIRLDEAREIAWRSLSTHERTSVEHLLRAHKPTGWHNGPRSDITGHVWAIANDSREAQRLFVLRIASTWPLIIHERAGKFDLVNQVNAEHAAVHVYGAFDLDRDGDIEIAFGLPGMDDQGILDWETLVLLEVGSKQRFSAYTNPP